MAECNREDGGYAFPCAVDGVSSFHKGVTARFLCACFVLQGIVAHTGVAQTSDGQDAQVKEAFDVACKFIEYNRTIE